MKTPETAPVFDKPTEDYLRVMTASPEVAIADVAQNTENIVQAYRQAIEARAEVLALPELTLTGYSAADLLQNQHVLEASRSGLLDLADITKGGPALIVGLPIEHRGILYNCAAVLAEDRVVGVVPKTHLPNAGEFYERRWFTSGKDVQDEYIDINGEKIPFGTDLIFDINGTKVGLEICEDAWAPVTPSTGTALAGAEVIINLSASNEIIGKTGYRRQLVSSLAGRLICGYVYVSAGKGESTADLSYGGHQMISEVGHIVDERKPHDKEKTGLVYDLDTGYILHDRLKNKTFADQAAEYQKTHDYRVLNVKTDSADEDLIRKVNSHPFVPSNPETLNERCEEIFANLAEALAYRLDGARRKSGGVVLGLSGGLDSTLALLIAAETTKLLGEDNDYIHTVTMPGPASSEHTQDNATLLAKAMGTTHKIMPIQGLTDELLTTIGHDGVTEDIAFENTQARVRTAILMNYANMIKGMVQGTGDMSENILGWCTYNGDHMSMFNPNAAVPKTLVRHLVDWYADNRADPDTQQLLKSILDTPISPELTGDGDLSQTTEDVIGPYELHDFFGYELLRHGSRPQKIGYLATQAFGEKYDQQTIDRWLKVFFERFTANQWKREAMPNGTKIGTAAVSPRGDLRMAPDTAPKWWH